MADHRIIKCLMLTTSPNDSESLAAIRKANDLLAKENKCWMEFYGLPEEVDIEDPTTDWSDEIDRILRGRIAQKWIDILSSIKAYYLDNGHLSDKQQTLVRKFMR